MISRSRREISARVAGVTAALGVAVLLVLVGPRLADLPPGLGEVPSWFADEPERAFATTVGLIAWICLIWLCAGVILGALAALPGAVGRAAATLARWMLPRTLRRLVEVSLGVTLVAGSVVPALGATPAAAAAVSQDRAATTSTSSPDTPSGFPDLGRQDSPDASPDASPDGWPDLGRPETAPDIDRSEGIEIISLVPVAAIDGSDRPGAEPTDPPTGADSRARLAADAPDPGAPHASTPPTAGIPPTAGTAVPVERLATDTDGWPDLGRSESPAPGSPGRDRPVSSPQDPIVSPAPRGTGIASSPPAGPAAGHNESTAEIVVVRGDTLWDIAARHLGPGATTEQIAAEWPRWWAANADVIGRDPDLILPGQRLQPPTGP